MIKSDRAGILRAAQIVKYFDWKIRQYDDEKMDDASTNAAMAVQEQILRELIQIAEQLK